MQDIKERIPSRNYKPTSLLCKFLVIHVYYSYYSYFILVLFILFEFSTNYLYVHTDSVYGKFATHNLSSHHRHVCNHLLTTKMSYIQCRYICDLSPYQILHALLH